MIFIPVADKSNPKLPASVRHAGGVLVGKYAIETVNSYIPRANRCQIEESVSSYSFI